MKYIVYITTNLINNKIYIGIHRTENPDVFDGYLGNGLSIKDKYLMNHPKEPFHYAVKKYGIKNFKRKTIKVFDNIEEALEMEREIVDENFIRRKDTYNVTIGGGLPPTYKKTIYQYTIKGEFIKQWSSIREAASFYKCSESCIGRAVLNGVPSLKYFWTDYFSDPLDISDFKIDGNKVKTYLYTYKGEYIAEFNSISDCAKYIGLTPSRILHCINDQTGILRKWRVSLNKYDTLPIPVKKSHRNCPVYQYDLQGNFIKLWDNISLINKFFGKNVNIANSIKQGHSCQGYLWSWEKVPYMKKLEYKSGRIRKVGKYDLNNNLISQFKSVNEAKRIEGSGIIRVLKGLLETSKGYIYRYIND